MCKKDRGNIIDDKKQKMKDCMFLSCHVRFSE